MSEDKIQNTKEALLELSKMNLHFEIDRTFIRNGANAINQLQLENKQLKERLQQSEEVIEEAREFINKTQYDPELKNKVYGINYGGTIKLLDILNKYKKEESR